MELRASKQSVCYGANVTAGGGDEWRKGKRKCERAMRSKWRHNDGGGFLLSAEGDDNDDGDNLMEVEERERGEMNTKGAEVKQRK